MPNISKNKNLNHYHTDPKLIHQINCKNTLHLGSIVYLDTDYNYKLAYSDSNSDNMTTSLVQGVVYGFKGNDYFYLKINPGPMEYKYPLDKKFFNYDGTPSDLYIPGNIGSTLWLSEYIPGKLQSVQPTNNPVIIGYKTDYGFLYRPKIITTFIASLSYIQLTYSATVDCTLPNNHSWIISPSHQSQPMNFKTTPDNIDWFPTSNCSMSTILFYPYTGDFVPPTISPPSIHPNGSCCG